MDDFPTDDIVLIDIVCGDGRGDGTNRLYFSLGPVKTLAATFLPRHD
ncbi:MAG: hypothetical protein GF350_08065 [Chitinivibrionales bacterium]|nr:hypothetical protein [Chitinivibrionales bacterium]